MRTRKKHVGRGHRSKGRGRTEIKAGYLGSTFFDHVESVARARGERFSDYIRNAIIRRLKDDGSPFAVPEGKP